MEEEVDRFVTHTDFHSDRKHGSSFAHPSFLPSFGSVHMPFLTSDLTTPKKKKRKKNVYYIIIIIIHAPPIHPVLILSVILLYSQITISKLTYYSLHNSAADPPSRCPT